MAHGRRPTPAGSARGADNYDSLHGDGLDFGVLEEYASMAPEAWNEVLRPALSDRFGRALFIGTPKGLHPFTISIRLRRRERSGARRQC